MLLALLVAACGDDTFKRPGAEGPDEPEPTPIGTVDNPSNGTITVNEAKVIGSVADGKLTIKIPVTGDQAGAGELTVSVQQVDGTKVFDDVELKYDVKSGEKFTLKAVLDAPKNVDVQADRAAFNLQIKDATILNVTRSLLHVVPPYEVRLEGPKTVTLGKAITYRVSAQDPLTQAPKAEQPVELWVYKDDELVEKYEEVTGESGNADTKRDQRQSTRRIWLAQHVVD